MPDKVKVKPISGLKPHKKPEQENNVGARLRRFRKYVANPARLRWITLVFMSLVVAVLLSPNVLSRPASYNVGDVASRDIKASQDFLVENKDLTEKDREKASREVLAIYDFDGSSLNLIPSIREAFDLARDSLKNASLQNGQEGSESAPSDTAFSPKSEAYVFTRDRFFGIMEIPVDDRLFQHAVAEGIGDRMAFAAGLAALQRLLHVLAGAEGPAAAAADRLPADRDMSVSICPQPTAIPFRPIPAW